MGLGERLIEIALVEIPLGPRTLESNVECTGTATTASTAQVAGQVLTEVPPCPAVLQKSPAQEVFWCFCFALLVSRPLAYVLVFWRKVLFFLGFVFDPDEAVEGGLGQLANDEQHAKCAPTQHHTPRTSQDRLRSKSQQSRDPKKPMTGEAVISSQLTCKTQLLQILPDLCMVSRCPWCPGSVSTLGSLCTSVVLKAVSGRAIRQSWLTHQNTLAPADPCRTARLDLL